MAELGLAPFSLRAPIFLRLIFSLFILTSLATKVTEC